MNEIARRLALRLFDRPVIQNQYRSDFVEEMIAPLLAVNGWRHSGENWAGWDFERSDGLKLEVKQSSAQQTWKNANAKQSVRRFDIAPRKGYFVGAEWRASAGRLAQVYVFAWNGFRHPDVDHRNAGQWTFYVVAADNLPESSRSVSLTWLENWALSDPMRQADIDGLRAAVASACDRVTLGK